MHAVVLAFGRQRQKEREFKDSLALTVSPRQTELS